MKIRDNEIEAANFCDMNRNERHRLMNKHNYVNLNKLNSYQK